jgi:hypothetical protein
LRIDSKLFRDGDALPLSEHPPQGMEGDSTTTVDVAPHHDATGVILGRTSLEVRISSNMSDKGLCRRVVVCPLLVLLCVIFADDTRGTDRVQFGHSSEQLDDFAARE